MRLVQGACQCVFAERPYSYRSAADETRPAAESRASILAWRVGRGDSIQMGQGVSLDPAQCDTMHMALLGSLYVVYSSSSHASTRASPTARAGPVRRAVARCAVAPGRAERRPRRSLACAACRRKLAIGARGGGEI